jgi:hypothetical protein
MKKIDLGQSLSLLANFGVIVGIALLVIELSQTNAAIRGATYQAHAEAVEEWDKFLAQSEILTETIIRYQDSDFSALSSADQFRLFQLSLASFNRIQNLYRQYELGLVDQIFYDHMLQAELEINVPRWEDAGLLETQLYQTRTYPEFHAEVEKYLDSPLVK